MTKSRVRIGVLGANGRMGQVVRNVVAADFENAIDLFRVDLTGDLKDTLSASVVIDFSSPEAVLKLIERFESDTNTKKLPALVIGSTGWKPEQQQKLDRISKRTLLLQASNFSLGVQLTQMMLRAAAPHFKRLGYSVAVKETHHVHKKDRPSGTALALMKTLKDAGYQEPECVSIREGETIGTHEIRFSAANDEISLRHTAHDRSLFGRGAIEAALWLARYRGKNQAAAGSMTLDDYFRDLNEMG